MSRVYLVIAMLFIVLVAGRAQAGLVVGASSSPFRIDSSLYGIDLATGAGTFIGSISSSEISALAFDDNGNLYGSDIRNDRLLRIDANTGASVVVGSFGLFNISGLAFNSSNGVLYGWDNFSERLAIVNTLTGQATPIGAFGAGSPSVEGIEFDGSGNLFAVLDVNNDQLARINVTNSTVTTIGFIGIPFVGPTKSPTGLAFHHPTGVMYGVDSFSGTLETYSLLSGAATTVGSLGFGNVSALAIQISAVPEPSSFVLLGIFSPALILRRRSRMATI